MIIDLANTHLHHIKCMMGQQVYEHLLLYTPDRAFAGKIKDKFASEGWSREVQNLFEEDETEVSYVYVNTADSYIRMFRSITSHYELFYYQGQNGRWIVTDHMRNMLSYIPLSHRKVSLEGVCDVFLYQHSYGRDTYVQGVFRLGCGELWESTDGKIDRKQQQFLTLGKYDLKGVSGADVLEDTLREACGKMQSEDCVNTLSGGVDSTLTHIIMGNPKSVSGSYEYEKFLHEKQYALEAARLLGAEHTVYDIQLEDYMEGMTQVARYYGLSPYNLTAQVMHYTLAKNVSQSQMMVSELAGAVYGLELRTAYTPEKAREYPMEHPYNYANVNSSIAMWQDVKYLERIFGKEVVDGQLEKRNAYVLSRLKNFDTADISSDNYLQLGHLMYYYSNSGVGILEQTEMAFGKTINALFSAKKVVESFLSLDINGRYEDEVYGEKPFAKQLLERLLPGYEVNKPKLGGSLPRTWMVTEGPMAGYFKHHEIPDFADDAIKNDLLAPSWENSWGVKYMIMYSIWYENVMKQELPKLPSKVCIDTENP